MWVTDGLCGLAEHGCLLHVLGGMARCGEGRAQAEAAVPGAGEDVPPISRASVRPPPWVMRQSPPTSWEKPAASLSLAKYRIPTQTLWSI